MKIVRNFNDFVKKRINEDVDPIENPTVGDHGHKHKVDRKKFETIEEVLEYLQVGTPELEVGMEATKDAEAEDQSNLIDEPEESYEEEESGEYEGTTKLKKLAETLGAELTNNEINYEGHKINWFSETGAFHVVNSELEPAMESRRFRRNKK